tara:strand:- start:965 stop:1939 length:975 start_codon:yes stop_codon:yes gene_type:complete
MPILCKVNRGDFIESMHVAFVVVVDSKGSIVYSNGDAHYLTCVRSALKPFQASASVKAGATKKFDFSKDELALMCASHNGEKIHVKTAMSILNKIGYDMSYYECGSHSPYDKDSKKELLYNNEKPSPLHNNCSGKHGGMLSLANYLKEDPKGYTNEDHPVQMKIMEQVKHFSELEEFPTSTDGCSAPVPFLPLYNIALMYQKLAGNGYDELNILYDAIVSNPYHLAGKDRFDTDFITAMDGNAVTKIGGEGVRGLGIRTDNGEAYGMAIKIIDGSQRCNPKATIAILKELKLINDKQLEALHSYDNIVLQNHRGLEIGSIQVEL